MTELSAQQIADQVNGVVEGDASVILRGVAGIREAQPGEISYVTEVRYAEAAKNSQASVVMVSEDWTEDIPATLIKIPNPENAFYQIAARFAPPEPIWASGVDERAHVHPEADLGEHIHVSPGVVIEAGAAVGANSVLLPGVYIGPGATVGEHVLLYPNVVVREHCVLGNRVTVHSNSTVGSDGFGYYTDADGQNQKIPQTGIVILEDDVEIGANVAIDRARFGVTRVGRNAKIDNLVQIAHNCEIGPSSMVASQAGFSGSTRLGHHSMVGGQVGTVGHIDIGPKTILGARSGVTKELSGGQMYSGFPARPFREDMKLQAASMRVGDLLKKVRALEKRIEELETS